MKTARDLARERSGNDYWTRRSEFAPRSQDVGVIAEDELQRAFGLEPTRTNPKYGDGGVDVWGLFRTGAGPLWCPCDVKGSRRGNMLVVRTDYWKQGTIYVKALVDLDAGTARLTGWEGASVVRAAPVLKNWLGNGPDVYAVDAPQRPIEELLDRLIRAEHRGR